MTNDLREALEAIASWRDDTLGKRPKEPHPFNCAPEIAEAFDRGARMALIRCADRAAAALAQPAPAGREAIARIIDGYADSYRMMANDGDGKVLASSVHTDLLTNIKPAILALGPTVSPQDGAAAVKRWEVGKNGWDAADEMTREDI